MIPYSPLRDATHFLLTKHHTAMHVVTEECADLAKSAHDEALAVCLESYLDHAADVRRGSARLLAERELKVQEGADAVLAALLGEAAAIDALFEAPAAHDALLARTFLRIQHCHIAALGVLHSLAQRLDDEEIATFARDALAAEIAAEESLCTLFERQLGTPLRRAAV